METYCRGCLKEFEPSELLQYSESNRRLYVYCTGLQVKRNDAFTFQLCKECSIYMKLACKFKKQCRSSDRKFKTFLGLKTAGENIDFHSYMKNVGDTFTLTVPNANRSSSPLCQQNDDDDDNESTCTSIQNFMTDIRETLQEEDVLTAEDNIIREVIQEEADISDDSLDSHWLEDDEVNEFAMGFNFSANVTPLSSNEDRCNTPMRITTDEEDTCHYVHKDVILKSDKAITVKNKKSRVNDAETHGLNETNAEFSDDNLTECNELAKTSNQNDMPLLDDCDMAFDCMMESNELESEFSIANVANVINKSSICSKEIATDTLTNSTFATKLDFYARKDVINVSTDNLIKNSGKKLLAKDAEGKTIDNQAVLLGIEQNSITSHYPEKSIQQEEFKVENDLEKYIAYVQCKRKVKCAIDKNLETALKNDAKHLFPLEQLLKSPHVSEQSSGYSTPTVHNILFGNLTPIHNDTPELSKEANKILHMETQKQVSQSPKVNDMANFDEAKSAVRIFKGSIKSEGNIFNSKSKHNKNRGYKDIARLKHILAEENMYESEDDICDSSDETDTVDKEFDKTNVSDIISEDEDPNNLKGEIVNGNVKEKIVQTPVNDDLDISITNLLEFDENQSVDLNISIASDFLEEEQKESISDQDEMNNEINEDDDVMNEDGTGEELNKDAKYKDDNKQQNKIEDKDSKHLNKEEQSENVFKKPLPPPDDKYDLNKRLCKICDKKFKTVRALRLHFGKGHKLLLPRSERKNVPKVCEICGKVLADWVSHKRHLKIHEGPVKCLHCSLPFKSAGSLKLHMRSHTPANVDKPSQNTDKQTEQKRYVCILCDKEFKQSSNFYVHMRRHDKNYTIKCEFCNKGFVRKYDLQQHIVQHTKELPFSCELCPKQFKSRYMLVGHMYIHMGIKKLACQNCGSQFETNQSLQQHYRKCQIIAS